MTIKENTASLFRKARVFYITRSCFNDKKIGVAGPSLYVSGRALLTRHITIPNKDTIFLIESQPAGFIKRKAPYPKNLTEIRKTLKKIEAEKRVTGVMISELWDLVRFNQQILIEQFKTIKAKYKSPKHLYIIGQKNNLYIDHRASIHKFVTIDLSNGPVYIDRDVIVRSFSTIIGPTYIGPNTIVDRAKITGSSIGPFCCIGGEVEACIFQGYANKHHEGFLGHSFVGEWVNLGALTTNSDLKNNYGRVRMIRGKRKLDSGMTKLGCFIGDHAKTGIGTLIPTGAKIGSFANFFGGGMMPKNVPNFAWLSTRRKTVYDLKKAIATARVVMQRRNVVLSKDYEGLIRSLYKWQISL